MTFRHVNNRCWLVYASSFGKQRVKKTHLIEEDFAFHIFNMAQNDKPETAEVSAENMAQHTPRGTRCLK